MRKALLLITVLLMTCACSPTNSPEAGMDNTTDGNQVAYGLLGPGPINYGVIRDDVDEYRYDGMINQSPSFRTLDRHRTDLGDDQDKIQRLLVEEGLQPSGVFIIGKDVWVNARTDIQDTKERENKQKEVERVLTQAMQRYDIHLTINP